MLFADSARKVGKVAVAAHSKDWPKALKAAQEGCVVLRCEYRGIDDSFHMDLLHEDFPELSRGQHPPRYDVIITADGNTGEFVRTGFVRVT